MRALLLLLALAAASAQTMRVDSVIVPSHPFRLAVDGLAPRDTVRIHLLRVLPKWAPDSTGAWRPRPTLTHAWADFAGDAAGRVDVATATPLRGTYARADEGGLWYSALPVGRAPLAPAVRPGLYDVPPDRYGVAWLRLDVRGAERARRAVRLTDRAEGLQTTMLRGPDLHAVFATPPGNGPHPAVILLHGSEGGDFDPQGFAQRFASAGFAAMALQYFARTPTPGLPSEHVDLPLERLNEAYRWLARRPEVDSTRVGVFGLSKGAEFALLGATRHRWVRATAACVPTDIVWEGYGRDVDSGAGHSSWSEGGVPLPYVPLFHYDLAKPEPNTQRYTRSRLAHPDRIAAARIPVERAHGALLLLGADADEVWASGDMTRALAATLEAASRRDVQAMTFPGAGHGICGSGTLAPALFFDNDAFALATGAAEREAWRQTLAFFWQTLR